MANKPTRIQDSKVVMAKLSREDFIKLQKHCEIKKESVNSIIRKAILHEVDDPVPHMLAGKNVFIYSPVKDNFSWQVILDNGLRVDLEDNLPAEYVLQLFESIKMTMTERNNYLKKENKDTVSIPTKLLRKRL